MNAFSIKECLSTKTDKQVPFMSQEEEKHFCMQFGILYLRDESCERFPTLEIMSKMVSCVSLIFS